MIDHRGGFMKRAVMRETGQLGIRRKHRMLGAPDREQQPHEGT